MPSKGAIRAAVVVRQAVDDNGTLSTDRIAAIIDRETHVSELVEALESLLDAFIHTEGNTRGNKAKTDIIKYNQPHVSDALNKARAAIAKAKGE